MDNIEYFDADYFGYSPVEAELMDPQVRIFHECAWHALENAGYDPFPGDESIGIYAGAARNLGWEVVTLMSGKASIFGDFATQLLLDRDILCTRVSYNLNLKGPGVGSHWLPTWIRGSLPRLRRLVFSPQIQVIAAGSPG